MSQQSKNSANEYSIQECLDNLNLKFTSDSIETSYLKIVRQTFADQIQKIFIINLAIHILMLVCLETEFDYNSDAAILEMAISAYFALANILIKILMSLSSKKSQAQPAFNWIYIIQIKMTVLEIAQITLFTEFTEETISAQNADSLHRTKDMILLMNFVQLLRQICNTSIYYQWYLAPICLMYYMIYSTSRYYTTSATFYLILSFLIIFIVVYYYLKTKYDKFKFFYNYTSMKELKGWKKLIHQMIPMPIYVVKCKENLKVVFSNKQSQEQFEIKQDEEINTQLKNIKCNFLHKTMEEILLFKVQKHSLQNSQLQGSNKERFENIKRRSTNYSKIFHYFRPTKEENYYDSVVIGPGGQKQYFDIKLIECAWEFRKAFMLVFNNVDQKMIRIKQEKISKFKSKILSQISHDLKTPLNGIFLQIESCIANNYNNIQSNLQDIKNNTNLLLHQINKLVDFAKLQTKQFSLNKSEFALAELLSEIEELYINQAKSKKIKLFIKYYENIILHNDRSRLIQIITTLLDNSFKFTFKGRIELDAYISKENSNHVVVKIIDTGLGIPEQQKNEIFKMIKNGEESNLQNGFGFGIPYCKQIINIIGPDQKIFMSSRINEGTEFMFLVYKDLPSLTFGTLEKIQKPTCTLLDPQAYYSELNIDSSKNEKMYLSLPMAEQVNNDTVSISEILDRDDEGEMIQQVKTAEYVNFIGQTQSNYVSRLKQLLIDKNVKSILIVDDIMYNIIGMKQILNQMSGGKLVIEEAYNGEQAVNKIINGKTYDMIFMDVNMPLLDGFAATKAIKDLNSGIQIHIMTAFNESKDEEKLKQCGADSYMSKPITIKKLTQILSQL